MKSPFIVLFFLSLLLVLSNLSIAQRHTISGYIRDSTSNESLVGANLYDMKTFNGTSANNYGFYSLTLEEDSLVLIASFVGYESIIMPIYLLKDTVINFNMSAGKLLDEVIIQADRSISSPELTQMSAINIPVSTIKALPSLLGETDILKVIQLLPGVMSGAEGTSGMYVRGGGPDQNLILLDGVPVYNASHLFGFFSVFNADAINNVDLIKGGFPARFGGRLSSVLDITMKEGNSKKFSGTGSIGLIASKLTLEGPIQKDKSSFIISARRTYADLIIQPIVKALEGQSAGYFFYDVNVKVNHKFSDNDRIYLSMYTGKDKAYSIYEDFYYDSDNRYDFKDEAGLQWGNLTSALRWNHVFNKKLFSNATLTYSNYLFTIFSENYKKTSGNVYEENIYQRGYQSSIKDIAARADFEYFPDSKQDIRFGASAIGHVFRPGVVAFKSNVEVDTTFGTSKIYANELDAYIEDDIKITKALKANIGLHGSAFFLHDTSYYSLQPRVSARYMLDNKSSVKASFSRMTQYIHLLTNTSLGLPTDLWVPAMKQVTPQNSNQYAVGLARSLGYDFEITLEGFYKTMNNLIEYSEGASFLNTSDEWYEKVEMGKGTSKGIELFIQRKAGVVNGWIGYTLSKVTREFETLNGGKPFPFKYDRTHDVSIVLNAEPREDMDVSAVWVYGTGNAITLPRVKYAIEVPGDHWWYNTVKYYGERNSFRMPAYHRFDISATWHKPRKWGETSWTVGVFNLYNRRNPFYIDLGMDRQGRPKFIQYSFFQLIPSASYSFKF